MESMAPPSSGHLRVRYVALLEGEPVTDGYDRKLETYFDRWREITRMTIVYGLPRDESVAAASSSAEPAKPIHHDHKQPASNSGDALASENEPCSLRGRIWKSLLGVEDQAIDRQKYRRLVERGASYYDADIRNDTFRTFRGDANFAHRVPEDKLVRLLNAFFNELGASSSEAGQRSEFPNYFRYVQGMNVICAPLLYVMPEEDAYHTFCQLLLKHCPKYMAPQLCGVEHGCILVDQCLEIIDPELYRHLSSRGITARIYALPLILSLFACVPPLQELLRVWDVLFAVGVHFVVLLAVAHTVLLRGQLLAKDMDLMKILSSRFAPPLQSDQLISVALQLLHRLPDDLLFEIARHPLEDPDSPSSLPFSPQTAEGITHRMAHPLSPEMKKAPSAQPSQPHAPPVARSASSSKEAKEKKPKATESPPPPAPSQFFQRVFSGKPPWKF